MSSLAERLKTSMAHSGKTQSDVAEAVGISQAAVQKITSGKTKSPSKIKEIAEFLGVNRFWLEFGEQEDQVLGGFDVWSGDESSDDDIDVPFLKDTELAAGNGLLPNPDYNGFKLKFARSTLRRLGVDPANAVCVSVKGDSMEPVLKDGSTVGVDTGKKNIVDGKMYAVSIRGLLKIKVLAQISSDVVRVKSYNSSEYPDEDVSIEDIKVEGWVFWSASTY
ncbi:helix-turn-helix transcriptional regulator [Vibrio fluvialis]|nr:helix-turn-helix transcriptional regulator [Vibrio fluvialis]MBY7923746.1 helix-turn-helix transcriptional regulator [Vibrio fluvialis]MBY7952241.1 helix-turn-helix transcriptional regulator [Vibrio fluvialis]MBY7979265.1 helix-turn-helix transcriptional regulator [Vibrio fluvialis]